MANCCPTTNQPQFDAALIDYKAAKAASDAVADYPSSQLGDQVHDLLENARETVFAVPAPRLGRVADKLDMYWGDRLLDHYWFGVEWRQTVVGDIRRNELQLAGVEEPAASGGLNMEKAAWEWAEAVQQHDHWSKLLTSAPQDELSPIERSDLMAFKDQAEATLLSLPAPQLFAVIKKLEILLLDPRFNPAHGATEQLIIRDVRRFALNPQQ